MRNPAGTEKARSRAPARPRALDVRWFSIGGKTLTGFSARDISARGTTARDDVERGYAAQDQCLNAVVVSSAPFLWKVKVFDPFVLIAL
jgi:hypothetical protein